MDVPRVLPPPLLLVTFELPKEPLPGAAVPKLRGEPGMPECTRRRCFLHPNRVHRDRRKPAAPMGAEGPGPGVPADALSHFRRCRIPLPAGPVLPVGQEAPIPPSQGTQGLLPNQLRHVPAWNSQPDVRGWDPRHLHPCAPMLRLLNGSTQPPWSSLPSPKELGIPVSWQTAWSCWANPPAHPIPAALCLFSVQFRPGTLGAAPFPWTAVGNGMKPLGMWGYPIHSLRTGTVESGRHGTLPMEAASRIPASLRSCREAGAALLSLREQGCASIPPLFLREG